MRFPDLLATKPGRALFGLVCLACLPFMAPAAKAALPPAGGDVPEAISP